ncbi:GCC2 and GCC3 domain containing protein [Babesia bovis T2Bo]|uniref:GCC2 and GCC3 domain containing protein n=1 Tax=Babesia bovis T2Bo TaxID=484906 RepID=UPI001DBFDE2E|nr:GCC2 and GCC3 domain containing protein [Babesia bovis T2Bo]EDO06985.2 GCC2 and GCC3 domain containing protein [Babesia bovis T2Bo]
MAACWIGQVAWLLLATLSTVDYAISEERGWNLLNNSNSIVEPDTITNITEKDFWCIMGMKCILPSDWTAGLKNKNPIVTRSIKNPLAFPYYTIAFEDVASQNPVSTAVLKYQGPRTVMNTYENKVEYSLAQHQKDSQTRYYNDTYGASFLLPDSSTFAKFGDEMVHIVCDKERKYSTKPVLKSCHTFYILKSPSSITYGVDPNGDISILLKDFHSGPSVHLGFNLKTGNTTKYNVTAVATAYGNDRIVFLNAGVLEPSANAGIYNVYVYLIPCNPKDYGTQIDVLPLVKSTSIKKYTVGVKSGQILLTFYGLDASEKDLHFAVLSAINVNGTGSTCGNGNAQWYELGFKGTYCHSTEHLIEVLLPLHLGGEKVLICAALKKSNLIEDYRTPFALMMLDDKTDTMVAPVIVNVDALGRARIVLNKLIHPLSEVRLTPADGDILFGITKTMLAHSVAQSTSNFKVEEKLMTEISNVSLDHSAIFRRFHNKGISMHSASNLTYSPDFSYMVDSHAYWSSAAKFFPKLLFGVDKLYKISVCNRWDHPYCLAESDYSMKVGYLVPSPFVHKNMYAEWEQNSIVFYIPTTPLFPKVPHITMVKINPESVVDYDRICNSNAYAVAELINSMSFHAINAFHGIFAQPGVVYYQHKYRVTGIEEGYLYGVCYSFEGKERVNYNTVTTPDVKHTFRPPKGIKFKLLTILNPMRFNKNQRVSFRNLEVNAGPIFAISGMMNKIILRGIYMTSDLTYDCTKLFNSAGQKRPLSSVAPRADFESIFGIEPIFNRGIPDATDLPEGFWMPMDDKSWMVGQTRLFYRGKVNATKTTYKMCFCYQDACLHSGTMIYSPDHTYDVTRFINLSVLLRLSYGNHTCIYGREDLNCFKTISAMKAGLPVKMNLNDSKAQIKHVTFTHDGTYMLVLREGELYRYNENMKIDKMINLSKGAERVFDFPNMAMFLLSDGTIRYRYGTDPFDFNKPGAAWPLRDLTRAFLDVMAFKKIRLPSVRNRIIALDIHPADDSGKYHIFYVDDAFMLSHSIVNIYEAMDNNEAVGVLSSTASVGNFVASDVVQNVVVKATTRQDDGKRQTFLFVHTYGLPHLSIYTVTGRRMELHGQMRTTGKIVDLVVGKNYLMGLTSDISPRGEITHNIIEIPLNRLINTSLHYPDIPRALYLGTEYKFNPVSTAYQSKNYYTKQKQELEQYGLTLDANTGTISGTPQKIGIINVKIKGVGDFHSAYSRVTFIFICQEGTTLDATQSNCVKCAKGTYWSMTKDSVSCLKCTDHIKNSTTINDGSKSVSDCLCPPGTYLKDLECIPCPLGTTSNSYGSENCPIIADAEKGHSSFDNMPSAISCKAGTFLKGDACVPCTVGYYCLGGILQPFRCSHGMTTERAGAKSGDDCLCDAGYEWSDGRCVPCGRTSYKENIGNNRCTPCPSVDDAKGMVYTPSFGSTSIRECIHCTPGYYYDANRLHCIPCPADSFCPGKAIIPLFCPNNTVTNGTNAGGRNDCLCVKGYGYASTARFILSLDNSCTICPVNTFQHVNGTNMPCLQCPKNTYTVANGSVSLSDCLPGPGFYIAGGDGFKTMTTRLESIEPSQLQASSVKCVANVEFDDSFSVTVLAKSLQVCIDMCKNNIYCRYVYYGDSETGVAHNDIVLSGEVTYIAYRPCKMFMYYERISVPSIVKTMQPFDKRIHRYQVLCEIFRGVNTFEPDKLVVRRCPMNHYCPGGDKFGKYQCPENSTTLMDGANNSSHCLCLPGFELSTSSSVKRCVSCKEGFYKDNTSNARCLPCPPMMTTTGRGAVSASQCVCNVGYFATTSNTMMRQLSRARMLPPVLPRRSRLTEFMKNNFNFSGEGDTSDILANITCKRCPDGYVCPGKWLPNSEYVVHNPPISCPDGSAVPQLSASANSLRKCICKPGYGAGTAFRDDVFLSCQKCAPGTFSETYSTSTCHGRCNDYAISFPGASSFKDCFCLPGRFMTLQLIENKEKFVCKKCSDGTICPGGFTVRQSGATIPDNLKEAIFSHTPQYPRMGYMAIFKRQRAEGSDIQWLPNKHDTYINEPPTPSQFGKYEHVADIHPCVYSNRCNSFGKGGCSEGSYGYLCGKCAPGFDARYLQSDCVRCKHPLFELLDLFVPRLILMFLVCLICHMNNRATTDGNFSIIAIFKIWYIFELSLIPLGMQQLTTSSSLVRFYNLYHNYFFKPILLYVHNERLNCWRPAIHRIWQILRSWGVPLPPADTHEDLDYNHIWYMQRFLGLAKPLIDALLLCILYYPCRLLYSRVESWSASSSRRISLDERIFSLTRRVNNENEEIKDKEEAALCLKTLDDPSAHETIGMAYIKHRKRGKVFLIQQLMLLMAFHLPSVVVNSLAMLWCGSVKYKDGDAVKVLMHLPEQICDPNNRLFFIGRIVGLANLGLWLLMLAVLFVALANYKYGSRSWNTIFMAGSDTNCRWWDAVHLSRQFLIAVLIVCHYGIRPKGDTEYMRAACYFILHFIYVTLHLTFSPYDKRNNESFNNLESLVLFSNLCMCIFIQGSYFYDFSDFGGFPIVVSLLVHVKIIWTIMLEYGHIQFANMKNNGKGELANMIIDFFSFAFEHRTANVYYDYKNDNLVMESSKIQEPYRSFYYNLVTRPLLKLAHLTGISMKGTEKRKSYSYSLQNRDFLVECIRNTIQRCSVLRQDVVLSDKWFYFITRYVFWYCHCLHVDLFDDKLSDNDLFHKIVLSHFSPQENISDAALSNFFVNFPIKRLSAHNAFHHNGDICDGKCAIFAGSKRKRKVEEVAESLLVECLFDTVYDLGPVTLVEFYLGLLSLNHFHESVLIRMFDAYRIHALYLKDERGFRLLREADALNENINNLKGEIEKTENGTAALQRHTLASDIEELETDIAKLNDTIDRERQVIMAGRAAAAVALNLHLGVDNIVSADLSYDDILSAISQQTNTATDPSDRRKGLLVPVNRSQR